MMGLYFVVTYEICYIKGKFPGKWSVWYFGGLIFSLPILETCCDEYPIWKLSLVLNVL